MSLRKPSRSLQMQNAAAVNYVRFGPFASILPCLGHARLGRKIGITGQRCGRCRLTMAMTPT